MGYTTPEAAPSATPSVWAPSASIHPAPLFTDFWASETDLRVGDVITVKDSDGVLCGMSIVTRDGEYLIHVYGDEPSTAEDEGAKVGERLQFFVNQNPVLLENPATFTLKKSQMLPLSHHKAVIKSEIPKASALFANFPNPFNPETWIPYQLAKPADVQIQIYDQKGRLVQTLYLGRQEAGIYTKKDKAAYWNGRNAVGEQVASGVYFYRLRAGSFTATRKMTIIR